MRKYSKWWEFLQKDTELREKLERVEDVHCKNEDSCLVSQLRARRVNLRSAENSE